MKIKIKTTTHLIAKGKNILTLVIKSGCQKIKRGCRKIETSQHPQ